MGAGAAFPAPQSHYCSHCGAGAAAGTQMKKDAAGRAGNPGVENAGGHPHQV